MARNHQAEVPARSWDGRQWVDSPDGPVSAEADSTVPRWDYRVIRVREGRTEGHLGGAGMERQFQALGAEGWELCAALGERFVFKRAM